MIFARPPPPFFVYRHKGLTLVFTSCFDKLQLVKCDYKMALIEWRTSPTDEQLDKLVTIQLWGGYD